MRIPSGSTIKWRVDLIRKHVKIGEAHVIRGSVSFDAESEVMHSMDISVPVDGLIVNDIPSKISEKKWEFRKDEFSMFADRMRPVVSINGTDYDFGDFIVISAPIKSGTGKRTYEIEAYDETMILKEAKTANRIYYAAGTKYISIIDGLLMECGFTNIEQDGSDAVISCEREWGVGETYISIINTLLEEIGYAPIHTGSMGKIYVKKHRSGSTADHTYTDKNSTLIGSITSDTDIYSLPNVIVGYVSSPDIENSMLYKRENHNRESKISLENRGYPVVNTFALDDCPDMSTLETVVDQKFLDATQATETATVETLPDGSHDYETYISLEAEGITALYKETGWKVEMDGDMTHEIERKALV